MKLLVTGASGYVGRKLVDAARRGGHEVAGGRAVRFDLEQPADATGLVAGIEGIVHLAAVIPDSGGARAIDDDPNVRGTRVLLDAARRAGVKRFVFASSLSAGEASPTSYGRSKWAIEQMLTEPGEGIARLGLVCGGAPRALYGRLLSLCRRHSVLPLLSPGAPVYPVHVDDVAAALLSWIAGDAVPDRMVWIGGQDAVRFDDFLRTIALERLGIRMRLIPVPAWPVLAMSAVAEALPGLPSPPTERIRGLAALRPVDTSQWPGANDLGVPLRDVREALRKEGGTRRLVREGRALTQYVLGARATSGMVRRYVRAVRAEKEPAPLDLPGFALRTPALIRAIEPVGPGSTLRRRLDLATAIVEMTPEGAQRFHVYEPRPRLLALAGLARLAITEAAMLLFRAVFGRIVSRRR